MGLAAIHPLVSIFGVVIAQGEVGGGEIERLAQRNSFHVQRIGNTADRWLRTLVVYIPGLKCSSGLRSS